MQIHCNDSLTDLQKIFRHNVSNNDFYSTDNEMYAQCVHSRHTADDVSARIGLRLVIIVYYCADKRLFVVLASKTCTCTTVAMKVPSVDGGYNNAAFFHVSSAPCRRTMLQRLAAHFNYIPLLGTQHQSWPDANRATDRIPE